MMPDNRECAALFWLAVALLWALSRQDFRSGLKDLLSSAFRPVILLPLTAMLAYVALEVWIGYRFSLWETALLKDTIVWVVASGLAMFFDFGKATEEQFFRRAIRRATGAFVFVEFFMNLVVFSLFWELLVQPVLTSLILLSLVADLDESHREVKKWIDRLLAVIGFSLIGITAYALNATWSQIDKHTLVLQFLLPVWLTIGFLPCVYFFSLYVNYDAAFRGINYATNDWKTRCRAKIALVTKVHFKARDARAFNWNWARRIASAPGFSASRQVVDQFYKSRRDAEQAVIDERERLERYAGSRGTDDRGHRLDRREFKETIAALRYLGSCQMGWYRNRGGHYHADLIDRFRNDFTRQGLPPESGITMRVARDGQAWYAWRRTITGWCFAIGAGGPPPEEWEYDGPEPPDEVPGKDPRWGQTPFSGGVNANWGL
jgi:hypothetical protein